MRILKSIQRKRFEEATFPYLEALWRTALRLTEQRNLADNLVLKTITKAYSLWKNTTDTVCTKKWLFRILARELFEVESQQCWLGHYIREYSAANVIDTWNFVPVSIDNRVLSVLPSLSNENMKEAISRLKPQPRLILLLLVREHFTYEEIAYITDLQKESVRTILSRCRRQIYRYLLTQTKVIKFRIYDSNVELNIKKSKYAQNN
ncbi:MAG: sigma-70 family RNA polymerase sigma factor [bacterium]